MTALGVLLGWSVTGYLVWRAWPGIRSDWRAVGRRVGLEGKGRYGRRGGGVL